MKGWEGILHADHIIKLHDTLREPKLVCRKMKKIIANRSKLAVFERGNSELDLVGW